MSFDEREPQLLGDIQNTDFRKRVHPSNGDYYPLKIAKLDPANVTHLNSENDLSSLPLHSPYPSAFPVYPAMFFPFSATSHFIPPSMQTHQQHGSPSGNCVFNNSKDSGVGSDAIGHDTSDQGASPAGTPDELIEEEEEDNESHENQIDNHNFKASQMTYAMPPGTVQTFGSTSYNSEEVFELVPARTALLAASTKHKVTIGEVNRRINPPECLHASLINGILRKAKAKDGGKALRTKLSDFGIYLPQGRRKTAPATSFTALCEEEAIGMARDFHGLCEDFSAQDIGNFLVRRSSNGPAEVEQRRQQLHFVRSFLDEMSMIILTAGSHPKDYEKQKHTLGQATLAVQNFGLLTHGFGPNALMASISVLRNVVTKSMEMIGGGTTIAQDPKVMNMMNMSPQMMSQFSSNPPSFPMPSSSFIPSTQQLPYFYGADQSNV